MIPKEPQPNTKNAQRIQKWCQWLKSDWNFTIRSFTFSMIALSCMAVILGFVKSYIHLDKDILASTFMLSMCLFIFLPKPIFHYLKRRFIRQISAEDKVYLESIAQSGNEESTAARLILEDWATYNVHPKDELLRASKPTDEGILLRPTTGNTETRKEELLGASEERQ